MVCVRYWVTLGILSVLTLSFDPLSRFEEERYIFKRTCQTLLWFCDTVSGVIGEVSINWNIAPSLVGLISVVFLRVLPGYFLAKGVLALWSIYSSQQPINWGLYHCHNTFYSHHSDLWQSLKYFTFDKIMMSVWMVDGDKDEDHDEETRWKRGFPPILANI